MRIEQEIAACFDASVFGLRFSDSFHDCEVQLHTSDLREATMTFVGINRLAYQLTNPHARLNGPTDTEGAHEEYVWVDHAELYP